MFMHVHTHTHTHTHNLSCETAHRLTHKCHSKHHQCVPNAPVTHHTCCPNIDAKCGGSRKHFQYCGCAMWSCNVIQKNLLEKHITDLQTRPKTLWMSTVKRRSVTDQTIHQRKLWDVKLHIDPPFNAQKAHRQWINGRKDNHCCRWNDHDSKGIISKSNNRHVQKITKVLVRKTTKVLVQKATKTLGNNWMVWCCTG